MAKRKARKKATKKTAKKAKKSVKRGRSPGRPRGSAAAATMQGAVANINDALSTLINERAKLDSQISALQGALNAMGAPGSAPRIATTGGGPGRRRSGSLKEYIEQVLAGNGVMAVKDITDGVLAAGYQTRNRTLAKSVGIALTEMPNVKKVGRGKFQLK